MKSAVRLLVAGSVGLATLGVLLWRRRCCRCSLKGKSLIAINDLATDQILHIMKQAKRFKVVRDAQNFRSQCCFANWFYRFFKNRPSHPLIIGMLFMEPSTRTQCSFEAAAARLGCSTVCIRDAATSSAAKGEKIEDTARMLQSYCDALVIRHPEQGIVSRLSELFPVSFPLVNGGDGSGEHPTQALVDLFAIEQDFPGRLNNWKEKALVITCLGDLLYGRTVHSLARVLMKFNTRIQFLAAEGLSLPSTILSELDQIAEGKPERHSTVASLVEALQSSDVVYCTRLQKERFESEDIHQSCLKNFTLTSELLDSYSPKHQIVLHPLPRLDEIDDSVDSNPRQRYFRQAADGVYVRMALLSMTLGI